ncbi:MAG: hypothetical protein K9K33_15685, partial [Desulfarculaceae bacterium]|nr:hypothetical protein [Desulfarculaceae bacterium]
MKLPTAARVYIPLLTVLVLLAGCSAMVTTAEIPVPPPGPQIKAGLKAVMPPVVDKRYWPPDTPGTPDTNVHIFGPAITAKLRSGLTQTGLFAALPTPDSPSAELMSDRVVIRVTNFSLTELGNNPWAAPAYIIDGLVQPVSGVILIATKGQVDTGAYLLPSTRMGTTINADLSWSVKDLKAPVLKRSYLVVVELGSVSGRQLRASLADTTGYGVKVGKAEGQKALDGLVEVISRDPHWLYLGSYIRLARARVVIEDPESTPEQRMEAAGALVGLLQPLIYSPEEAKVLQDGLLNDSGRAAMANELRARYLGLAGADALPAKQRLTEAQAKKLFDDPSVGRAWAHGEVTQEALGLIMSALTPRRASLNGTAKGKVKAKDKDKTVGPAVIGASNPYLDSAGGARNPAPGAASSAASAPMPLAKLGPPEVLSPQAKRMQAQLATAVAEAMRNHPRLQALYLSVADESVGLAWFQAKSVLSQIGSPQVKNYLAKRDA